MYIHTQCFVQSFGVWTDKTLFDFYKAEGQGRCGLVIHLTTSLIKFFRVLILFYKKEESVSCYEEQ